MNFTPQDRPTMVTIMGQEYQIKYVRKVDSEDSMGSCDVHERIIRVKWPAPGGLISGTLLHECLHAILYISGQAADLSAEREEGLVLALENGLGKLFFSGSHREKKPRVRKAEESSRVTDQ